ncbi:MAG: NAD(P)/FAD-dependent oxidoreductase [Nocardioides sp.]
MDAVVVGSGPNGLAAAVTLAQQGLAVTVLEAHDEIGGGTRTAELTVPGVLHDVCSAVHPLGIGSPYLASLPLADHGLVWRWPEVDLAHPLDDGTAGVLLRDLDATAEGLGVDGDRWRSAFGPLAARFDDLAPEFLGPVVHLPRRPVLLGRFGLRAALPATVLARWFRTDAARALFAGCAAHIYRPLNRPTTAGIGTALIAAGHRHGWPVAEGGSRAVSDALASLLLSLGGQIRTGVLVRSLADLPDARIAMFDTTPTAFADIAGRPRPRWRYGPGAHKLDLAVRGGVPWTAEACRRAGTVHVGGTLEEIVDAERTVHRGRLPERPFVLVAQQYLADPTRSAGDVHPLWAYAHVPHGYDGDPTELVLDQLERFAPGLRERIVGQHVTSPAGFEAYNPNYVGGDIAAGAVSVRQLVRRAPYATGVPGAYLCSASTAPGAGVHGMCGHHAARRALEDLTRR